MSTLTSIDDLFAKKDRKKKRAAARLAQQATESSQETPENTARPDTGATTIETLPNVKEESESPPHATQPDDGWIEIEDVRGSQVNTGGRTVAEFRR